VTTIEADDLVPTRDQVATKYVAKESTVTGDQNIHGLLSSLSLLFLLLFLLLLASYLRAAQEGRGPEVGCSYRAPESNPSLPEYPQAQRST